MSYFKEKNYTRKNLINRKYHFPREINEWTDFYLITILTYQFQECSRKAICENITNTIEKNLLHRVEIKWKKLLIFRELQENVKNFSYIFQLLIFQGRLSTPKKNWLRNFLVAQSKKKKKKKKIFHVEIKRKNFSYTFLPSPPNY